MATSNSYFFSDLMYFRIGDKVTKKNKMKKADGGFCLLDNTPLLLIEAKRFGSSKTVTDPDVKKLALGCKYSFIDLKNSGRNISSFGLHVNGKYLRITLCIVTNNFNRLYSFILYDEKN